MDDCKITRVMKVPVDPVLGEQDETAWARKNGFDIYKVLIRCGDETYAVDIALNPAMVEDQGRSAEEIAGEMAMHEFKRHPRVTTRKG